MLNAIQYLTLLRKEIQESYLFKICKVKTGFHFRGALETQNYRHWINKEFAETRAPLAEIQGEHHSCVQLTVNPGLTLYTVQDIDRKGEMKPSNVCSVSQGWP